jgi:hypothetical protein
MQRVVKKAIDRDPKYVFCFPNVQSIVLWLFQSQEDPKIKKLHTNIKLIQKSKNDPKI